MEGLCPIRRGRAGRRPAVATSAQPAAIGRSGCGHTGVRPPGGDLPRTHPGGRAGGALVGRAGLGLSWIQIPVAGAEELGGRIEDVRRDLAPMACTVLDASGGSATRSTPGGPTPHWRWCGASRTASNPRASATLASSWDLSGLPEFVGANPPTRKQLAPALAKDPEDAAVQVEVAAGPGP